MSRKRYRLRDVLDKNSECIKMQILKFYERNDPEAYLE
jgi:hypothetical protein